MSTASPAEVLQAVYEGMREGDWPTVRKHLAADFTVFEPESLPYGGEWRGADALERLFPAVMQTFDDPEMDIAELHGGVEWATCIVRFTVTSKATGRRFTQPVAEVGRVVDGKLVELRIHYFDTAKMLEEMGSTS